MIPVVVVSKSGNIRVRFSKLNRSLVLVEWTVQPRQQYLAGFRVMPLKAARLAYEACREKEYRKAA